MKSHTVSSELVRASAQDLAKLVREIRGERQRPIDAYAARIMGQVAGLGYGVEFQTTALLHRSTDKPGLTFSHFYMDGCNTPLCVRDAVDLLDRSRYLPIHDRVDCIKGLTNPIMGVVTYSEALAVLGGAALDTPYARGMSESEAEYVRCEFVDVLPPIDCEV